jgi:hypothetical protein
VALERLYQRTGAYRDLVATLRSREQGAGSPEARRAILTKIAETLADQLDDKGEAILAFRSVLDEFGADRATLTALEKLYESTERYADLADYPRARPRAVRRNEYSRRSARAARRSAPSSPAGLGGRSNRSGKRSPSTLRMLRAALASRSCSMSPTRRREAAETLHPLHEADGDFDQTLKVLEIEAESADTRISACACSSKRPALRSRRKATRAAPSPTRYEAFARRRRTRDHRLARARRTTRRGDRSLRRARGARARDLAEHPRRRRAAHDQPANRRACARQASRPQTRAHVLPEGARTSQRGRASPLRTRIALRKPRTAPRSSTS